MVDQKIEMKKMRKMEWTKFAEHGSDDQGLGGGTTQVPSSIIWNLTAPVWTRRHAKERDGSNRTQIAYLIDHVSQLSLGWVLAEGPHDGAELLGGDGSISV